MNIKSTYQINSTLTKEVHYENITIKLKHHKQFHNYSQYLNITIIMLVKNCLHTNFLSLFVCVQKICCQVLSRASQIS